MGDDGKKMVCVYGLQGGEGVAWYQVGFREVGIDQIILGSDFRFYFVKNFRFCVKNNEIEKKKK